MWNWSGLRFDEIHQISLTRAADMSPTRMWRMKRAAMKIWSTRHSEKHGFNHVHVLPVVDRRRISIRSDPGCKVKWLSSNEYLSVTLVLKICLPFLGYPDKKRTQIDRVTLRGRTELKLENRLNVFVGATNAYELHTWGAGFNLHTSSNIDLSRWSTEELNVEREIHWCEIKNDELTPIAWITVI